MFESRQPPFVEIHELHKIAAECADIARATGRYPDEMDETLKRLNDADFDRIEWFAYGAVHERESYKRKDTRRLQDSRRGRRNERCVAVILLAILIILLAILIFTAGSGKAPSPCGWGGIEP